MIMTNGFGATIGTLAAMAVVNHFVPANVSSEEQLAGWRTCWYIFAGYALVVAVLFFFLFHDKASDNEAGINEAEDTQSGSGGMVSGNTPTADLKM